MFFEDQELQNHFIIGGHTREEWATTLCEQFADTLQAKELLLHSDISPQHINAPIQFIIAVTFSILRYTQYDPCKQYEVSIRSNKYLSVHRCRIQTNEKLSESHRIFQSNKICRFKKRTCYNI